MMSSVGKRSSSRSRGSVNDSFVQFSGIEVNSAQENLACCRRVLEIL